MSGDRGMEDAIRVLRRCIPFVYRAKSGAKAHAQDRDDAIDVWREIEALGLSRPLAAKSDRSER